MNIDWRVGDVINYDSNDNGREGYHVTALLGQQIVLTWVRDGTPHSMITHAGTLNTFPAWIHEVWRGDDKLFPAEPEFKFGDMVRCGKDSRKGVFIKPAASSKDWSYVVYEGQIVITTVKNSSFMAA